MAFLPFRGDQVTVEEPERRGPGGYSWTLLPSAAKVAVKPGPVPWSARKGRPQIRIESLRANGGSLVAGTSLDQVIKTIDQVEVIVAFGSVAVSCSSARVLWCCAAGCARSRPWPGKPT